MKKLAARLWRSYSLQNFACLSLKHRATSGVLGRRFVTQSSRCFSEQSVVKSDFMKDGDVVDPLSEHDFFKVRDLISVQQLFDARVHYGHKTGTQNELMRPYIFGNRLGVDIIDLDQTKELLGDALNFTAHMAFRKGIILFVTRNRVCIPIVEQATKLCGEYAHCRNFIEGTFTNQSLFYGLEARLPDLVIFISTHNHVMEENWAVTESAKMNIPTIALLDTNSDPRLITYPVPANDDSTSSVRLLCNAFSLAIRKGKVVRAAYEEALNPLQAEHVKEEIKDLEALNPGMQELTTVEEYLKGQTDEDEDLPDSNHHVRIEADLQGSSDHVPIEAGLKSKPFRKKVRALRVKKDIITTDTYENVQACTGKNVQAGTIKNEQASTGENAQIGTGENEQSGNNKNEKASADKNAQTGTGENVQTGTDTKNKTD